MREIILVLAWVLFAGLITSGIGMLITSANERRWRAVRVSLVVFVPACAAVGALLASGWPGRLWLLGILDGAAIAGLMVLVLPYGNVDGLRIAGDPERTDERAGIFHRFYRLKPGMAEYESHYTDHPEQRAHDERIRALPHLGQPGGRSYHPLSSPYALAIDDVIGHLRRDAEWEPSGGPIEAPAAELTRRVKGFARYLGADTVGATALNQAWVYSNVGRGPGQWGAPIELDHPYALAIGVEMDRSMVRHAPDSPTMTETTKRYLESATVAIAVARYINRLGYRARAHVDGSYRVLCGPIGADAGLGELGRIGLLITPRFGPRVRLSVVSTDMPLEQDEPVEFGVQHFCEICRKCATCCPSRSIDRGPKGVHNGVKKWQSNQERCYHYWRLLGTDCAICVNVCPYSHPDTPMHNLVRWLTTRNPVARRAALFGDDLFYGRRPSARCSPPGWHDTRDSGVDVTVAREC
jgi:hypothetical protein